MSSELTSVNREIYSNAKHMVYKAKQNLYDERVTCNRYILTKIEAAYRMLRTIRFDENNFTKGGLVVTRGEVTNRFSNFAMDFEIYRVTLDEIKSGDYNLTQAYLGRQIDKLLKRFEDSDDYFFD